LVGKYTSHSTVLVPGLSYSASACVARIVQPVAGTESAMSTPVALLVKNNGFAA
jgi:hypothetical protein